VRRSVPHPFAAHLPGSFDARLLLRDADMVGEEQVARNKLRLQALPRPVGSDATGAASYEQVRRRSARGTNIWAIRPSEARAGLVERWGSWGGPEAGIEQHRLAPAGDLLEPVLVGRVGQRC
jgi:hypothetical protein